MPEENYMGKVNGSLKELTSPRTGAGRAFVIGCGPSLEHTPMDLLIGETTFAMNRIHLRYDLWKWRPTHYVFVDFQTTLPISMVMQEVRAHIEAGEQVYVDEFMREKTLKTLKSPKHQPDNVHFLKLCDKVGHIGGNYTSPKAPRGWHFPSYCKFASGLFVAMQIAVMLGHDPIILIACDLGYVEMANDGPDPNHMHPDYVFRAPGVQSKIGMTAENAKNTNGKLEYGHQIAYKSCKAMGVQVFNAGLGGQLHVYPRVELEELLD